MAPDPYDDDDKWGKPVAKVTPEQAQALNEEQRAFTAKVLNPVRLLQGLVVVIMLGAFIGYYQGATAIKEAAEDTAAVTVALGPWEGAVGAALWYGLGALSGGLSLLVPLIVYAAIARSRRGSSAAHTLYDLLRAEVLKYGLMILCLGAIFKLTTLPATMVMLGFALMMVVQVISSILVVVRRS